MEFDGVAVVAETSVQSVLEPVAVYISALHCCVIHDQYYNIISKSSNTVFVFPNVSINCSHYIINIESKLSQTVLLFSYFAYKLTEIMLEYTSLHDLEPFSKKGIT